MPLEDTLRDMARDIAHVSISEAEFKSHAAGATALAAEIDRLRKLPLKDCEPSLVFVPVSE